MFQITPTAFIGCDVGKSEIVVFDSRSGRVRTVRNDADALDEFAAGLDGACLVVCEATGGYEAALLDALSRAARAAHRADACKVKAFLRSFGTLGKSDRIDARALAAYGQERHATLARWRPAEAVRDRLRQLVMLRRDLLASRIAWSNRHGAPGGADVAGLIQPVLDCLAGRIAAADAELRALLDSADDVRRAARALRAIPGIGPQTAAALIALMPELGRLNRRQAAALAGLAPHPNQSGGSDRYRRLRGGRPEIKRTLFLAAMAAAKHHPALAAFHQRLRANGKRPLVALAAVMRRLIVIANAVLRDANERSLVRP